MAQTISSAAAIEEKAFLREKILSAQSALNENAVERMSAGISGRFFALPEYRKSKNILVYLSLKKEVQTESIIKKSFEMGKRVFVPVAGKANDDLLVSELPSLKIKLEKGAFGIRVPEEKDRIIVPPGIIDLAVLPGLAFSREGTRLGRGKGHYDRLLTHFASHVMKIGLAFDFQMLDFIPRCQHDAAVNKVLTENETFNC